jgi:hypothetical protein
MAHDARGFGKRLTPAQAAKSLAAQTRERLTPNRFIGKVSSIVGRETTGTVTVTGPASEFAVTVQVRANVDLAANDFIWVREDQGAQGTFVFDGFTKGGGTGNNDANDPIPWVQGPGIISPPGDDLTVEGASGQDVNLGAGGQPVNVIGDLTGVDLDNLDDVSVATPSDGEVLTWVNAASEWQAKVTDGLTLVWIGW